MGHYLNPKSGIDKEFWLHTNGGVWHPTGITDPDMWHYYANKDQAVICLIQNDGFQAAVICVTPEEIARFQRTEDDTRLRMWWTLPLHALYKENPEVKEYYAKLKAPPKLVKEIDEGIEPTEEEKIRTEKFKALCNKFEEDVIALGRPFIYIASIQEEDHTSVFGARIADKPTQIMHSMAQVGLQLNAFIIECGPRVSQEIKGIMEQALIAKAMKKMMAALGGKK